MKNRISRPYTLDGLMLWLDLGMNWRDFRAYHADDDFSAVIRTLVAHTRIQRAGRW